MGWDAPIGGSFHLYINGVYWGVYNAIERPDEGFARLHFGGDKEDYDYLKDRTGLMKGTRDAWDALIASTNLADPARYQQVQQLLDVTAFADYTLLQIFGGNTDRPAATGWPCARAATACRPTFSSAS